MASRRPMCFLMRNPALCGDCFLRSLRHLLLPAEEMTMNTQIKLMLPSLPFILDGNDFAVKRFDDVFKRGVIVEACRDGLGF